MNWLQLHLAQTSRFPDEALARFVTSFPNGKNKIKELSESFGDDEVEDMCLWMLRKRPDFFPEYLAKVIQQLETEEAAYQQTMYPDTPQHSYGFLLNDIRNGTVSFDDIPDAEFRQKLIDKIRMDIVPTPSAVQFMVEDPNFREEIEETIIDQLSWDGGLLKDLGLPPDFPVPRRLIGDPQVRMQG
jgi:hypothetical protein